MPVIQYLDALEILDSRGRPTIAVTCVLASGAVGTASVPSGASTGQDEAHERRDGDPARYGGRGCLNAVEGIRQDIQKAIQGRTFANQHMLDNYLLELDGTPNKMRLGANALLGVSLAYARACATEQSIPLYRYFSELAGNIHPALPRLTINLFSGGKHAGGQVAIQDVLIVPRAGLTVSQSLAIAYDVYQSAVRLIAEKYHMRPLTADEGGLAPSFPDAESMLQDAIAAIKTAGYTPGEDMLLAVDAAASHFYHEGKYQLGEVGIDAAEMIAQWTRWAERYPLVSIEDGLAENDWEHWPFLKSSLSGRVDILGDDFLCTNPSRIQRAVDTQAADALLLKVNQIGTLTEAVHALQTARAAGWNITISARSGETEDNWLADLAVGWAGDFIKIGSITQSDRLAKYNRLLAIEHEINHISVNQ
jgi:enolase